MCAIGGSAWRPPASMPPTPWPPVYGGQPLKGSAPVRRVEPGCLFASPTGPTGALPDLFREVNCGTLSAPKGCSLCRGACFWVERSAFPRGARRPRQAGIFSFPLRRGRCPHRPAAPAFPLAGPMPPLPAFPLAGKVARLCDGRGAYLLALPLRGFAACGRGLAPAASPFPFAPFVGPALRRAVFSALTGRTPLGVERAALPLFWRAERKRETESYNFSWTVTVTVTVTVRESVNAIGIVIVIVIVIVHEFRTGCGGWGKKRFFAGKRGNGAGGLSSEPARGKIEESHGKEQTS